MLIFDQVHYYYRKGQPLLASVSFEIQEGEFVAIVGGNGSGKSTLARLMNGLLQPREGEVRLGPLSTRNTDDLIKIREQVGLVFQSPDDQFITTSVLDEVVFGLENLRVPREEMSVRAKQALRAVQMEDYAEAMPHELSGGQKQRTAIASILAMRPRILVFDEATSMLDPQGRSQVLSVMHELHRQGMTIIHITHHMDEVLEAERVLLLNGGAIAFDGTPPELFRTGTLADHPLDQPFAVRLQRALGLNTGLKADWKEMIRTQWPTS
ncbi:energy-coupling factor transporter ATPase [Paenibacillus sp. Marseille-P2973]|uniref:energy-coupling factor transporter ATPase n=1 Tax=Paenibacillus sp. Marseille-P2973 TaxID=1871032 RepID=UPI001B36945C|nr:energy-coupling factor transporter ATPase [Paenibacillus sp. Marseille-P2973]MBQ4901463.1 energy-coupling factor transporter ATPase [Paenibacillus sp. Marseille-P2973]